MDDNNHSHALFASSIFGFGYVKHSFFPNSNTPMFFFDMWNVEGSDIRKTRDDILQIDEYLHTLDGVVNTAAFIGGGATRFTLVYTPGITDQRLWPDNRHHKDT